MSKRNGHMNAAECYRLLGVDVGADLDRIKSAYRRLARQYHPDINPDPDAQARFVQIAAAYKSLLASASGAAARSPVASAAAATPSPAANRVRETRASRPPERTAPAGGNGTPSRPAAAAKPDPDSVEEQTRTELDLQLKWRSYEQLQVLLKRQQYVRAVTLTESLARRLPEDSEVRQWQAIAYRHRGRALIADGDFDKARIYLKKALQVDPHNRRLWTEVEGDFRRLETYL